MAADTDQAPPADPPRRRSVGTVVWAVFATIVIVAG